MKIVEFLRPELVLDELRARDKLAVLREVAGVLPLRDPALPSSERLLEGLVEREKLRSTGIGDEVAVPHGRFPGLTRLTAAYARCADGIRFVGTDDQPGEFRHFIFLLAPDHAAGLHLKALARIMRVFRSATLRQSLLEARNAADIYRLIAEEDARC